MILNWRRAVVSIHIRIKADQQLSRLRLIPSGLPFMYNTLAVGDGFEPSNPFQDQTVFKTVPLANTVVPPLNLGAQGGIRTHRILILSQARIPNSVIGAKMAP